MDLPHDALGWGLNIATEGSTIVLIAGSSTIPEEVVWLDFSTRAVDVLRSSVSERVDDAFLSQPRAIEFPTDGDRTAHAFYYPPTNPEFEGPDDEGPPLIVMSHGGPTSDATSVYWTSRGFAVVDVNYGGSTGYGRAYRQRLNGNWGVVDLHDCVNAARFLVESGDVDGDKLLIRGGSAGGYTTICALTFTDEFAAGATYFGIADLVPFATGDTHKFECRYEYTLIGPWPEAEAVYRERSPINFVEEISTPMLVNGSSCSRAARTTWCRHHRRSSSWGRCAIAGCRTPTCCSTARVTASAKRRRSSRHATPSCRSTRRSSASSPPATCRAWRSRTSGRAQPPIALIERAGWTKSAWFTR